MNGLSGFALAGYLRDLERKEKGANQAIDTLNNEMKNAGQLDSAKKRTQQWLSSLTPDEISKLGANTTSNYNLPDSNFDFDTRAREIGLTSKFSDVAGVQDYIKSIADQKSKQKEQEVTTSLEEATKAMQRNKQFSDLNALEESVGAPKGDYGLKSNREIFTNSSLPKFSGDKRVDDFYKMNVEDVEKQQKAGLTPGSLRIGNRAGLIEDYRRPEMKDFVKKKLEEFKNKTGLDDDTYNGKLSAIDAGEGYNVSEFIDDYYSQGQKNKQRVDLENSLIDPRTKQTVSNESAKGNVEALTPKFKTDRKKEWDNFLGKYNEAYQQFALGKNAPDNNTGDVALINSLEKLRELNSAVMYGDYEKWVRPAQNMLQGLQDSGMFETIMARGENRLPADVRKGMQDLVQALWDNRKSILVQEQQSASQYAKDNFGWNDKLANDTYRMPKLGYEQGDTNVGKKPVVTEPTPLPKKTTPLDNVDTFKQREGDAILERQKARAEASRSKWGY